jgi:hypothetical protein
MEKNETFVFLPSATGGVLIRRDQIVGARPNGKEGAVMYTQAGPSIYTSLTTTELAGLVSALKVDARV